MVALAAGLITGGFAAWAYYDDFFRPLAHGFGLWITLLALLSADQRPRRAVVRACLALAAAVIAFYVGKKVMYGIDYPGMPSSINISVLTEWLILGVVAGATLGWAFSWAGRPGRTGALGTAAVIGLLVADAYRRSSNYHAEAPVVVAFTLLAVVPAVITPKSKRGRTRWRSCRSNDRPPEDGGQELHVPALPHGVDVVLAAEFVEHPAEVHPSQAIRLVRIPGGHDLDCTTEVALRLGEGRHGGQTRRLAPRRAGQVDPGHRRVNRRAEVRQQSIGGALAP
jgi:hypothetical protein